MSHFAVGVFVKDGDCLDDLLAPYQENNMGDCPKKYLEFVNTEDEHREEYETKTIRKVKTPDGRLLWPWDEVFRVPGSIGTGSSTHKVPEGAGYETVDVKASELYPTFEIYMADYNGYDEGPDPETGKYGYWENPNKKWDWWTIGGLYSNWLRTKDGIKTDDGQLKNLDLTPDQKIYKDSIRFWEIVVEGSELLPGEKMPFNFYRESYYINQYGTKEKYAEEQASMAPWAFITPDGVWHERGSMGWWATHDATMDSRDAFQKLWNETVASLDPDTWLVIVDCHI